MAKIYGLFGAMTGKLADTVMAVRNGEQLARKYQPVVFNPSTPAQVAQRAKMKLMSQLSAVLGPAIAIPRVGSVSSRNLFTKLNFPLASYDQSTNVADITLENVQITKSAVAAPVVDVFNRGADSINASVFPGSLPEGVSRVVYVLCKKVNDSLVMVASRVASEPGVDGKWRVELPSESEECIVYIYAVRDNNENARAKFGEMEAVTAETVAKLLVSRTITESDVTITRTVASSLPASA